MMAAAQPFISGAISKTINLPNDASEQDIKDCYRLSWELGLKANALYRDGCKLSQPLNSSSDDASSKDEAEAKKEPMVEVKPLSVQPVAETPAASIQVPLSAIETPVGRMVETPAPVAVQEVRIVERPMRRRLADTRASITHKFNIAGHEGYLTVGLYEDGMPGELFITMAKEGSTIGGLMDSLGTAVSVALQYGVPIEGLVNKFTHQRFEPAGMTANRDIPFAKSLVDYIFRWMGMEFIPGYREANAPKRGGGDSTYHTTSADETSGDRFYDPSSHPQSRATAGPETATPPRLGEDDAEGDVRDAIHSAGQEDRASWNNAHVSGSRVPSPPISRPSAPVTTPAGPSGHAAHDHLAARGGMRSSDGAPSSGGGGGASVSVARSSAASAAVSALSMAMRNNQEDAPACDGCGSITVRSGTCYKCLNCGASMGCS
jgi:ribonucleoside-diphosphate reductase alpha chain